MARRVMRYSQMVLDQYGPSTESTTIQYHCPDSGITLVKCCPLFLNPTTSKEKERCLFRCIFTSKTNAGEQCTYECKTNVDLVRHERGVHTDHKYTCGVCGAGFPQQSHLKTHIRSHNKSEQYVCVCGMNGTKVGGFTDKSSFLRHKKTMDRKDGAGTHFLDEAKTTVPPPSGKKRKRDVDTTPHAVIGFESAPQEPTVSAADDWAYTHVIGSEFAPQQSTVSAADDWVYTQDTFFNEVAWRFQNMPHEIVHHESAPQQFGWEATASRESLLMRDRAVDELECAGGRWLAHHECEFWNGHLAEAYGNDWPSNHIGMDFLSEYVEDTISQDIVRATEFDDLIGMEFWSEDTISQDVVRATESGDLIGWESNGDDVMDFERHIFPY